MNRCKDFYRDRSRRRDRDYLEDQDPYLLLRRQDMAAHEKKTRYAPLYDALAELPEMYREVLTLYYMAGMGSKEIAQALRISPNTVNQRLMRARAKLKTALSPRSTGAGEEMITMMSATFSEMKLRPGFTFYVVEAIKRTRIQTAPPKHALPIGVSAAAGLIAILLSLTTPYSPLYPIGELIGSALPSRTQVVEKGKIPVDTVDITKITILTSEKGEGDFGQKPKPKPVNFAGGGTWTKKEDIKPRAAAGVAAVNGKIYVIGGWLPGGRTIDTVEEYDPQTEKWTVKAEMPTRRSHFAVAVVDGKIYAIGGWQGDAVLVGNILPVVEVYDPSTNSWEKKADMPTPRSHITAAVLNGKIYTFGGSTVKAFPIPPTSTVEEYNPRTNTWAKKANMPTARWGVAAGAVNGKIYVIGGEGGLATVEEYNPTMDSWTRKADMSTPRYDVSASVVSDKIYVIGGMVGNTSLSVVEIYNPSADTWSKDTPMSTPRSAVGVSYPVQFQMRLFLGASRCLSLLQKSGDSTSQPIIAEQRHDTFYRLPER